MGLGMAALFGGVETALILTIRVSLEQDSGSFKCVLTRNSRCTTEAMIRQY